MGSYIEESLDTGESVNYTARVSLWRYALHFLVGGCLVAGSLPGIARALFSTKSSAIGFGIVSLLGLVLLAWPFIARRSTELAITNKRLIAKYGVLSTHSIEIRFDKIETVQVSQGLIGRILNYGDIVVTGTGSTFDPIRHIASALRFRMALNRAMDPGQSSG